MRATQAFIPTLREAPKDAELISHRLLLRAGFIRPLASGVYSYLPLGLRVINKISNILREEMEHINGNEFFFPALVPRELLEESGRDKVDVLFTAKPHDYFLGFTHEEVITDVVRNTIKSYKQLPFLGYQIQTKFRNEPRPRGGLIRGREFLMLDAYSFDRSEDDALVAYKKVRESFGRMFTRCGLASIAIQADSGAIGGSLSEEFMVLSEDGEDTVLRCSVTGYAANAERCEAIPVPAEAPDAEVPAFSEVSTPGVKTIEEVSAFLKVDAKRLIKTLVFLAPDGSPVVALVRGDRELNEAKLGRTLGGPARLADPAVVERVTGAPVGFAGPVGLPASVRIIADREVATVRDGVTGANKADAHFQHVLPGRDFPAPEYLDLRTAVAGDQSPIDASGVLYTERGIEVGHVFYLGKKYSASMHAEYDDVDGAAKEFEMGCYGLGVSRTFAAAIEQHHDADGIVWPITIAPFAVTIILVNPADPAQTEAAETLYTTLKASGLDVLLDDRVERPGVKFKDGDLIGVPVKVTVGKGVADGGALEIGLRRDRNSKQAVPIADAAAHVLGLVKQLKDEIQASVDTHVV
ncbi:proline--tRNA ligase [Capsulimonas corticalis]|uniref:Proline--tRNA ligase n=1 Tax=Capsulimonas corticalis TaxID=2219043 RepID=A0A402D0X0_9BACT|nr:proline--tRNA ligase [Capsulimonas corticalis]BDI31740.1 proline--tRNA ligase [Capsulimonas corticalis]